MQHIQGSDPSGRSAAAARAGQDIQPVRLLEQQPGDGDCEQQEAVQTKGELLKQQIVSKTLPKTHDEAMGRVKVQKR